MSRAIQLSSREGPFGQGARDENRALPLAGIVAAGVLHEAVEQQEHIDFSELFAQQDQFVLEVSGDSMIEAQILDGDYVVIKKQKVASPGQMVVARTDDGEATLKYWFPEKQRIRLQPANSSMDPIYVRNAEVLGVVVGVVRKLSQR
jgi:repressor LexA